MLLLPWWLNNLAGVKSHAAEAAKNQSCKVASFDATPYIVYFLVPLYWSRQDIIKVQTQASFV